MCWYKLFKDKLHDLYDGWMAGDENKAFTTAGNLKAPSFQLMLSWVKVAWDSIDAELIKKSFIVCRQTSGNSANTELAAFLQSIFPTSSSAPSQQHSTRIIQPSSEILKSPSQQSSILKSPPSMQAKPVLELVKSPLSSNGNGNSQNDCTRPVCAVSYTHLTLPTKRIV